MGAIAVTTVASYQLNFAPNAAENRQAITNGINDILATRSIDRQGVPQGKVEQKQMPKVTPSQVNPAPPSQNQTPKLPNGDNGGTSWDNLPDWATKILIGANVIRVGARIFQKFLTGQSPEDSVYDPKPKDAPTSTNSCGGTGTLCCSENPSETDVIKSALPIEQPSEDEDLQGPD